jgi:hypothetical protein
MLGLDSMAQDQLCPDARKQQGNEHFIYRIPTWIATAANNAPCAHTCRVLMRAIYVARHLAWPSEMLLPSTPDSMVVASGGEDVDDQQDQNTDGESFSVSKTVKSISSGGGWRIVSGACRRGDLGDSWILVRRRVRNTVVSTSCSLPWAVSK